MINGSEEIPESEIQWTEEPIIGMALLMGGKKLLDSEQNPVKSGAYYNVAKHLPTGMLIILPAERPQQAFHQFLEIHSRLN